MSRPLSLARLCELAMIRTAVPAALLIRGLSTNSKTTKPGDLFFAVSGAKSDGHQFVEEAAAQGSVAAVVEKDVKAAIPLIRVPSVSKTMSRMAHFFFEEPSRRLPVIGVTGTNGKTTTTYLIENILKKSGILCGVMGTVQCRLGKEVEPAVNTTPISIDVHSFLSRAKEQGAGAVAMEVSSHALTLDRVNDVTFTVGVFTNLTQDHLDFHKTMEAYFEAKRKLFVRPERVRAVINQDDAFGRRLLNELPEALSFGLSDKAVLRAEDPNCDLAGLDFVLKFPSGRKVRVKNNLMGLHNVANCLAAAGAVLSLGHPESMVVEGLNQPQAVPGRLERVEEGQKFVVVVDYAHTHDALSQVLTTLRNTGPRRLICVFGAGGDRDKTKRPLMGAVAARLSDRVFVTSDNPRSENPATIMKDIEVGIAQTGKKNYTMIEDRAQAIRNAIDFAEEGDVILIAGKGHEDYQVIGDKKIHFSDIEVARGILAK